MTTSLSKYRKLNRLLHKQEMALALDTSDDPIFTRLASLLRGIDPVTGIRLPELERMTLATLCHRAGANYSRMIEIFKQYKRSEAVVVAALGLPATIQGIVEDAQPREVTCAACEGVGEVQVKQGEEEVAKRCIPCEGAGKIRVLGDPVARKQILEMMELAGRGATNINAPGGNVLVAAGESLEETLRGARRKAPPTRGDSADDKLIDMDTKGKVQ